MGKKKKTKQKEKTIKEMRNFIRRQAKKALEGEEKLAFQALRSLSSEEKEFTFLVGELNAYLG